MTSEIVSIKQEEEELQNEKMTLTKSLQIDKSTPIINPQSNRYRENEYGNESSIFVKVEHNQCQSFINTDLEEIEEFDPGSLERSVEADTETDAESTGVDVHESDEIEIKHDPFGGFEFEGLGQNVLVTATEDDNDCESPNSFVKSEISSEIKTETKPVFEKSAEADVVPCERNVQKKAHKKHRPKRSASSNSSEDKGNKKSYPCKYCDKCFCDTSTRAMHQRIHTGDKRFKCNLCDKSFVQPGNLERHVRSHTKEKPFACSQCEKTFGNLTALSRHLRAHSSSRPYKCKYCNKSYKLASHIKRHMLTH